MNQPKSPNPSSQAQEQEADQAHNWALPEFESEQIDTERLNAIGKKASWLDAPTQAGEEDEAEEELKPLTIEDLEAMREMAYEEGLAEGKKDGLEQGLEEGRLKGLEEGHQQGLSQGLEQGLSQGQEQIQNLAARWEGLIDQLIRPLRQVDDRVQQQVVEMAMAIAAEIVRCELTTNQAVIAQTVKEAVAALPVSNQTIQISLHPDDLLVIEGMFPAETRAKKNWQLLADGSLAQGDCLVETLQSSVSVSMKSVIEQSLKQFIKENLNRPSPAEQEMLSAAEPKADPLINESQIEPAAEAPTEIPPVEATPSPTPAESSATPIPAEPSADPKPVEPQPAQGHEHEPE